MVVAPERLRAIAMAAAIGVSAHFAKRMYTYDKKLENEKADAEKLLDDVKKNAERRRDRLLQRATELAKELGLRDEKKRQAFSAALHLAADPANVTDNELLSAGVVSGEPDSKRRKPKVTIW